ncbi:MAG: peptidase M42 [Planctomycetales bacterium]|nr:peptidase M42 [Planctomycetales bacterium]
MFDQDTVDDCISLLRSLVREPSVVGTEDSFFRVLRRELEEFPVTVKRYQGLLVAHGSQPDSIYLSAHIDRNGLLCTGPNEFQYAAFIAGNRSELNGDSISEQFMETIAGRFHGQRVQAHTPYMGAYLGQGVINDAYVCPRRRNLIFEIEGLQFLQPGTPVSFLDRLAIKDGFLSAQLDNIATVAMVVHLFRLGFQGTALFAAGEEAGRSWRFIVEYFQRTDHATQKLLVLDTSPFPIEDAVKQQVVLRRRDSNSVFDPEFTQHVQQECDRLGISYCFKDEYIVQQNAASGRQSSLGRTELGRVMNATAGAIRGTTLQIPTTAYHTARESATIDSYAAMLRLLTRLAECEP